MRISAVRYEADYHPGILMHQLEIEIKFYFPDLSRIRRVIADLRGVPSGKAFETNIRYDDRRNSLYLKGQLLRLRKSGRDNILTHKIKPGKADRRFKVFRELEIRVDDFETTAEMLRSLGFQPQQVYEKWREAFDLGGAHLCLDEMPFGNFLEIEGAPDAIQRAAASLELDWKKRILLNYLEIFSRLQKRLKLPFSDVTFDNFNNCQIDPSEIQSQLESIFREKPTS
jgi:adenylate cyclase class 2